MHTEPHGHAKSPGNKEAPRRTKVPGQSKAQRHAKAPRHAEAPGHTETLRHAKAPGHRSTRTCKKLLMFKSIRLFGSTRTHRSTKMLNHQDTRKQAPGHAKVPGYTYALIHAKAPGYSIPKYQDMLARVCAESSVQAPAQTHVPYKYKQIRYCLSFTANRYCNEKFQLQLCEAVLNLKILKHRQNILKELVIIHP